MKICFYWFRISTASLKSDRTASDFESEGKNFFEAASAWAGSESDERKLKPMRTQGFIVQIA
jgi:hypothetical protein